jgi:hypothetical protein
MDRTTFNQALRRMGLAGDNSIGLTTNGFRATASTMLREAGFPPYLIELQLSHHIQPSYARNEHLQERRVLMQSWADLIASLPPIAGPE